MKRYLRSKEAVPFISIVLFLCMVPSMAQAQISLLRPVEGRIIRNYTGGGYEAGKHRGIDIEAPVGTPVRAATAGKVIYSYYKENSTSALYHTVSIEHRSEGSQEEFKTTYLQVKPCVKRECWVKTGDIIAYIAPSMDLENPAPHLHFGVRVPPYGADDYVEPCFQSLLPPPPDNPDSFSTGLVAPGSAGPSNPAASLPVCAKAASPQASISNSATIDSLPAKTASKALSAQKRADADSVHKANGLFLSSSGALKTNASEGIPSALSQEKKGKSEAAWDRSLSPALPESGLGKEPLADMTRVSPGMDNAESYSSVPADTSLWQLLLLGITFSLASLFVFKKRIVSHLSSRFLPVSPIYLKGT